MAQEDSGEAWKARLPFSASRWSRILRSCGEKWLAMGGGPGSGDAVTAEAYRRVGLRKWGEERWTEGRGGGDGRRGKKEEKEERRSRRKRRAESF